MSRSDMLDRRGLLLAGGAAMLAPALGPGLVGTSRAASPPAAAATRAWYRFPIGAFEATIVSDGPLILGPAAEAFPAAPPERIDELLAGEFLPLDRMPLEQNALIVDTGSQLVLFDTGMGTTELFGPTSGKLLAVIEAAGFAREDFDAVVVTHAHCDHVWGVMADDGSPNFPNAQIYISEADFDFWTDEAKLGRDDWISLFVEGARRNLIPNRDRLVFVADGQEFLPGIQAVATPGHTVGHMSFLITSNGTTMMNIGDVIHHHVLLFNHPRWEFAYDTDPEASGEQRVRILEMAATDRIPLIGYHFPFPGIGNVARAGDAWRYVPVPMSFI
jgi:glyoxylase-like metal-dependent hydrolase (beta-lactamase superfamily II)